MVEKVNEGEVKVNKILNYSSGNAPMWLNSMCCYFLRMPPVEGMLVECTCKTITKAGIHAQVIDDEKNTITLAYVMSLS